MNEALAAVATDPLALDLLRAVSVPDDGWIETDWQVTPGVKAFSTTRLGPGCSGAPNDRFDLARAGPDPADQRREALHLDGLRLIRQLPGRPLFPLQVHGSRAVRVETAECTLEHEQADALYTRLPDVVLGVRHADCLPLLISSFDGGEVAAVHAGWRGLAAGVIESTVALFEAAPAQIHVWLGPAIGPRHFEVGSDVYAAFVDSEPASAAAFNGGAGDKWLCDLYQLARQRLRRLGIENVTGGSLCTHGDARRFYSYRRDRVSARMATLIWRGA